MNTGDSILFPKSKQPSAGLAKQVRFALHLETESRNDENQGVNPSESRHTGGSVFQRETDAMDAKETVFAKDMQVQLDAQGANGLEMKKQVQNEPNEAGGGNAMADDQDMIEDENLKDNELLDETRDGDWHMPDANVRALGVHQHHQPQPPGPLIRWERFLPQRCLRVLLVENDDCTRQVVSALLRNCSYEVVAVANGQAAWRLLEDPSNHFDLVLTEVVMPCLSGIGLLMKIMGRNTCKNIPVIMMSSHDSMGIVFRCLSKGAVDFLVKPVRKNELKNLWQHVWRRCHSSSGSGSETGSQTQKALRPNNAAEQENNTGSNDESEDASIGLNRDGSDNGSGTQSSWTKRAVEVESPQQRSEWDYSHPHNSTIAQVIQPKITTSRKEWIPLGGPSTGERQAEKAFDHAMGKDLEIAVLGQKDIELECPGKKANEEAPRIEETGGNGESPSEDAAMKAADLIGAIGNQPKSDNVQIEGNLRAGAQDSCTQMKNMAFLELSLKRSHQNAKEDNEPEDRHVLRQSGGSAFTRYSTTGSQAFHPTGESCAGTSQQPKGFGSQSINLASGSLETEKTGTAGSVHVAAPIERMGSSKGSGGGTSTPVPITNQMSHSSNNQDLGSSVVGPSVQDHMFSVPRPVNEETMSALNAGNPQIGKPLAVAPGIAPYETMSRAYQPLYYPSMWPGDKAQEKEVCNTQEQQHQRPRIHQTQIHHHHHHVQHVHHHHHHHKTSSQHKHTAHENAKQQERDDQATMDNVHPTNTPPDGNNGGSGSNGNGNGSVSGSNNGSNGQNGSNGGSNGQTSAAVTAGAPGCGSGVAVTGCGANNGDSDTGGVGKSIGAVTTSGSGSGSGVENLSAREAALTKFRQKRKERCFEKKVRYQSRKKLAEQRPRVRGQFVRQPVQEPASMGDAE